MSLKKEIESGKRVGVSMGCSIEEEVDTEIPFEPLMTRKGGEPYIAYDGKPTFLYATTVPAPLCGECKESMVYLKRGTDWACRDASCEAFEVSVSTGIGGVIDVLD